MNLIKINPKIAELIGMHVGDGTLYKTGKSIVWELRGALNEKEYYYHNVVPLLLSIFKIKFEPKFRSGGKNGCFGIQTSKKEVSSFFIKFRFNPGRKTHNVRIPYYIKSANNKIQLSFLRGLFDTDGCLRFDKINNNKLHTYPRIEFGFVSKNLIRDLHQLLKALGYRNFVWNEKKEPKLCIAGNKMLEKWMKEVRPKNPKHLNKYLRFHKEGYVLPYAAVA